MGKKTIIIEESQLSSLLGLLFGSLMGKKTNASDLLSSLFGGKGSSFSTSSSVKNLTDKNFYERILKEIGAPVTDENLKFLYAWRQSEGKAGKYNPFNTTQSWPGATNFNSVGVKNYQSLEDGFQATIKTLKNGRYECILNGLRNNDGAQKISKKCSSDLKTWGTGDLVSKVISSYDNGASPKVSSLA